jgi:hypothetical protein
VFAVVKPVLGNASREIHVMLSQICVKKLMKPCVFLNAQQRRQDQFNMLLAQKDNVIQKINDIKRAHAEQEEKAAGVSRS